jgi:hypothetical protein
MLLNRQSIRKLFDDKIAGIFGLIEKQVELLDEKHPGKTIVY